MKYLGTEAEKYKTIENYKIKNEKIIIKYLDGHTSKPLPYSKELEKSILKLMEYQAIQRDLNYKGYIEFFLNRDIIPQEVKTALWTIPSVTLASFFYEAISTSSIYDDIFTGLLFCASVTELGLSIRKLKYNNKVKSEIIKYHIYLSIKDEIKKYEKEMVFNGIKKTTLNINTLDDFSLKELEKIQSNLFWCSLANPEIYKNKEKSTDLFLSHMFDPLDLSEGKEFSRKRKSNNSKY